MSKNSKVSVVIVVHSDYLKYLNAALESLKQQAQHELIIVCNGCYFDHPDSYTIPDSSLARACNYGIDRASGEYILRLDADDWIDSGLIQTLYESFDDEIDCVYCDYLQAHEHLKTEEFETFILSYLNHEKLEHACGAMFRKSVWEELGGYDEDLEFQEAFDFWARFHENGYKAHHINRPLYLYRRGHNSMSTHPKRDEVRAQLEEKYR